MCVYWTYISPHLTVCPDTTMVWTEPMWRVPRFQAMWYFPSRSPVLVFLHTGRLLMWCWFLWLTAANYSCSQHTVDPKISSSPIFSPNMSGATSQRKEEIIGRTGIWLSLNDAARVGFMYSTVLMWHTSVCSQENVQFDDRLQLGSNQKWNKGRAVLPQHFSYPSISH